MQSSRVYFNNIGSICTDSLHHGNGLSALLLLTRAAKSSADKSSASKTRSMESRLYGYNASCVTKSRQSEYTCNVFSYARGRTKEQTDKQPGPTALSSHSSKGVRVMFPPHANGHSSIQCNSLFQTHLRPIYRPIHI